MIDEKSNLTTIDALIQRKQPFAVYRVPGEKYQMTSLLAFPVFQMRQNQNLFFQIQNHLSRHHLNPLQFPARMLMVLHRRMLE